MSKVSGTAQQIFRNVFRRMRFEFPTHRAGNLPCPIWEKIGRSGQRQPTLGRAAVRAWKGAAGPGPTQHIWRNTVGGKGDMLECLRAWQTGAIPIFDRDG